jgi:hypothetical protein
VNIGEIHPCSGELVEVRRGDFALCVQALHVAVAEVVAENVNDVGLGRSGESGRGEERECEGGEQGFHAREFSGEVRWCNPEVANRGLAVAALGERRVAQAPAAMN